MLDEILSAYAPLLETERNMESARLALEKDACEQNVRIYSSLCEKFERDGGYLYKKEYMTAVRKFGFCDDDLKRRSTRFRADSAPKSH